MPASPIWLASSLSSFSRGSVLALAQAVARASTPASPTWLLARLSISNLANAPPATAADAGVTERRVDQLLSHIEQQLFASGAGDIRRTKLLVASLMKRPAVQRLIGRHDLRHEKLARAASEMLEHAKIQQQEAERYRACAAPAQENISKMGLG